VTAALAGRAAAAAPSFSPLNSISLGALKLGGQGREPRVKESAQGTSRCCRWPPRRVRRFNPRVTFGWAFFSIGSRGSREGRSQRASLSRAHRWPPGNFRHTASRMVVLSRHRLVARRVAVAGHHRGGSRSSGRNVCGEPSAFCPEARHFLNPGTQIYFRRVHLTPHCSGLGVSRCAPSFSPLNSISLGGVGHGMFLAAIASRAKVAGSCLRSRAPPRSELWGHDAARPRHRKATRTTARHRLPGVACFELLVKGTSASRCHTWLCDHLSMECSESDRQP
jgi:hypothetical protein